MRILKFGGTSVGKPERMRQVAELVLATPAPRIVVLSALSGTTNALLSIGKGLAEGRHQEVDQLREELYQHYLQFVEELLPAEYRKAGLGAVEEHFSFIHSLTADNFNTLKDKELVAKGELLSTRLFSEYLKSQNQKVKLLSSLDFMYMDEDKEPSISYIEQNLPPLIRDSPTSEVIVVQGFICKNHLGQVDNLKRGGSDYTASLIGAALRAKEVQIWTDIDGMHNNDPRIVQPTFPIERLSFEEAAELAYFGAKILHPNTIGPAMKYDIPVRLLNTMEPKAKGTIITAEKDPGKIKAIAAKDGITAIKIKSTRMLLAFGFLRKIFEIFENYSTPIDMITTSEVAVSITIDDQQHLQVIKEELEEFGQVIIDVEQTIVCIVGDWIVDAKGMAQRVVQALSGYQLRMISYGGSKNNISILIDSKDKEAVLRSLNEGLFSEDPRYIKARALS